MAWYSRRARAIPRRHLVLTVEELEDRCLPFAAFSTLPVIPTIDAAMQAHLQALYATGQQLGNKPDVFSKVGDSITVVNEFLAPLGSPAYDPTDPNVTGAFTKLAPFIQMFQDHNAAGGGNSFARTSLAAFSGWTSATLLNPAFSTIGGLTPLQAELATNHPAFALIMIGTNDVYTSTLTGFQDRLTMIVQEATALGVIPVLSTIPDDTAFNGALEPYVLYANQVIANVAASQDVPLWNYWSAMQPLPNLGLGSDNIHPSIDPAGTGLFTSDGLQYGYNVRNLTAVQVLKKLVLLVEQNGTPDPAPVLPKVVAAAGVDAGGGPLVTVPYSDGSQFSFNAFPATFTGGVRVAVGDVTGDGHPDVVVGAGVGGLPEVVVFDGAALESGSLQVDAAFYAYGGGFTGGVNVAVGRITSTAPGTPDDIVTGAGIGGGPQVNFYRGGLANLAGAPAPTNSFNAFPGGFTGGVSVAVGDVDGAVDANGLKHADIIVGAGIGGLPQVTVFNGRDVAAGLAPGLIASFFALPPFFAGGVNVAAGDLNGDGFDEVIVGAGAGAGPEVAIFDGNGLAATGSATAAAVNFYAEPAGFTGGVRVAVESATGSGLPNFVVTGAGPGGLPEVNAYAAASLFTGTVSLSSSAFGSTTLFLGGVYVAGNVVF